MHKIFVLCIKLVNYWDKYAEMHGQQNAKKKQLLVNLAHIFLSFSKQMLKKAILWHYKLP